MQAGSLLADPAALVNLNSGHPHGATQSAKLRDSANQFEAMLITQMLQSARESGDGSWSGDSDGEDSAVVELSQQQFAQALAANGGLGLAKMIVAGVDKHEN